MAEKSEALGQVKFDCDPPPYNLYQRPSVAPVVTSSRGRATAPSSSKVGFDCDLVEPPPYGLQINCPVCHLIIREPYQVTCCGKRFCQCCIRDPEPCPSCNAQAVNSFPDEGLKQTLYALRVHCSHKRDGCEWMGELGQLEEHFNEKSQPPTAQKGCQFAIINCEFHQVGCTAKLARKLSMPEHQQENLHKHMSLMAVGHSKLEAAYKQVKGDCEKLKYENEQLRNEVAALRGCSGSINVQPRQSSGAPQGSSGSINVQPRSSGCIGVLSSVEIPGKIKKILPSYMLTMTDYKQHKENKDWWFSTPVYTHSEGYKICIGVNASGCIEHLQHVSVYVYFMRGPYDDLLTWPFRGAIALWLVDQNWHTHKSHVFVYNDNVDKELCERVRHRERAERGLGTDTFISHSKLIPCAQSAYLCKNSLHFQIIGGEIHIEQSK